jgi:ABC-type branched-subunit amino acid transport system ATPase component
VSVAEHEVLTLSGVTKSFGGIKAIRDVSFSVPPREVTSLVGPNGAGKTTLFNLITGVMRPDVGSITYGPDELTALNTAQIVRRGVVRSFQGMRLFESLTVLEHVQVAQLDQPGEGLFGGIWWPRWRRYGRSSLTPRAMAILDRIGLASRHDAYVDELSLAEQKLLAVARLLATDASALLLDEPLAGLDAHSIDRVLDVLRALATEGKAVLLIEHNFDVVRSLSDRVVFLSEGEVMFVGPPDGITNEASLSRLYFGDVRTT